MELILKYPLDLGSPNSGNSSVISFKAQKLGFIINLPTPAGITFNTNASYNDISLGIIEPFATKALEEYQRNPSQFTLKEGMSGGFKKVENYVEDQIDKASGGDVLIRSAISRNVYNAFGLPMGGFKGLGTYANAAADFVQFKKQIAVNPSTTINFSEIGVRTFAFAFKMIAHSETEADAILDIIDRFTAAAHPEKRNDFMLDHPDTLNVKFLENGTENTKIPKIKECNITNFTATMNGQSSMFYNTGHASCWDITLGIKERTANTREDVSNLVQSPPKVITNPNPSSDEYIIST